MSISYRSTACLIVGICQLFLPVRAKAQDSTSCSSSRRWGGSSTSRKQQALARWHFDQAREREQDAQLAQALSAYQRALTHWDHPRIHGNLAHLLMRLDRPQLAYTHVRKALAHGTAPFACEQRVYAGLRSLERRLRRQVSELSIICPATVADVNLNGQRLCDGEESEHLFLTATEHTLVAKADGRTSVTRVIGLLAGEQTTLHLKMLPVRKLAPWKPWVGVGAGALLGMAGGLARWQSSASFERFAAHAANCPSGPMGCDGASAAAQAALAARHKGRLYQYTATASFAAAGVVSALGVALLFFNRPERSVVYTRANREGLLVVPMTEPGMVGVGVISEI